MTTGVTSVGFTKKILADIQADINAELLAKVDPALDLSPDQILGQIVAIVANREAKIWEIVETLCHSTNPDGVEGFLADFLCALSGTTRNPAKKSTVTLNCTVGAAFSATLGQMMANVVGFPNLRFTNKAAVGPLSAGVQPIVFESVDYGPIAANAGTLTVITAPVTGWTVCTNPLDATLGSLRETDAALMARRQNELTAPGACTVDSIRADVLKVTGVQQCFVFENTTLVPDATGLPGKAVEVVIYDGLVPASSTLAVANVIWGGKPSGVQTYGSTSQAITDATGQPRTVFFSRATVLPVWLEFDLTVDVTAFPATGAALVQAAVAAAGLAALNLGIDVVSAKMKAAALTVAGVLDVPALRLGLTAAPVGTSNLVITGRQIASLDTSRILVNATPGTP